MKINIAVAAGSAPKNWMGAMEREIHAIIPGLDTENMDEVDGDHGTVIKTDDWNELLAAFKSKGYKTRKTGSSNFEVHDKKYGPRYGIYAEVDGAKTHLTWMTPDRGDEDDEDDMLSESASSGRLKMEAIINGGAELDDMGKDKEYAQYIAKKLGFKHKPGDSASYLQDNGPGDSGIVYERKKIAVIFDATIDLVFRFRSVKSEYSAASFPSALIADSTDAVYDVPASKIIARAGFMSVKALSAGVEAMLEGESMVSESSDHVATAAKSPTAAQLKKAAAVLKKAKAAKSDKLNGNLDELFSSATALHKEADAAKRMNDAQVEKLRAQIDKLETKAENAYLKAAGKVKKVIDRAAKQMARMDKEGVKYTVPKVLASYFNLPAKSAAKADAADESLDSPTQLKKQLANLETSLKAIQGKKSEAAKRMRITKKIAALKERLASGKKTKRPSAE